MVSRSGRIEVSRLWRLPLIGLCLMVSGCNLQGRTSGPNQASATAVPDGPPAIEIASPNDGAEFVIGEEILVSVLAGDSIGVNRVQLFVDNQIVRTVSSESLQGELAMSAILNYVPQRNDLGTITLRAVAYRGAVVSEPDEITVVVRESASQVIATPVQQSNIPFIPNDGVCRALVNVRFELPHRTEHWLSDHHRAQQWYLGADNRAQWRAYLVAPQRGQSSGLGQQRFHHRIRRLQPRRRRLRLSRLQFVTWGGCVKIDDIPP